MGKCVLDQDIVWLVVLAMVAVQAATDEDAHAACQGRLTYVPNFPNHSTYRSYPSHIHYLPTLRTYGYIGDGVQRSRGVRADGKCSATARRLGKETPQCHGGTGLNQNPKHRECTIT